jgi:hypothetical protein
MGLGHEKKEDCNAYGTGQFDFDFDPDLDFDFDFDETAACVSPQTNRSRESQRLANALFRAHRD